MRATQADLTRVRDALGLEPSVDIREGLRRTVEWFSKEAA
jgi:nucleoside-diphosphate-sugar epimerase